MVSRFPRVALAAALLLACDESCSTEPLVDCASAVGVYFVEFASDLGGYYPSTMVNRGDSLALGASVRRVTESSPTFNPQGGWSCRTNGSIAVAASLTYSSADTALASVTAAGWVRGKQAGVTTVTAQSANPAAQGEIEVIVHIP